MPGLLLERASQHLRDLPTLAQRLQHLGRAQVGVKTVTVEDGRLYSQITAMRWRGPEAPGSGGRGVPAIAMPSHRSNTALRRG
jgi:hypothetical protein